MLRATSLVVDRKSRADLAKFRMELDLVGRLDLGCDLIFNSATGCLIHA